MTSSTMKLNTVGLSKLQSGHLRCSVRGNKGTHWMVCL